MKKWIKAVFAVSVLCLAACEGDPDIGPIKRASDEIRIGYQDGATTQFTIRFNGSWSASTQDSWLSLAPESGTGDGVNYQYITATAKRNDGGERKGTIILSTSVGGIENQIIYITQDDGVFSIEKPKIDGALRMDTESTAALIINYNKAFGNEDVVVETTMSGSGAQGLAIESKYETSIKSEGKGTIAIPITGTPESIGSVDLDITITLNGTVYFTGTIAGDVSSNSEVYRFGFDLFVWGGDYVANKAGISPLDGGGEADAGRNGTEPPLGTTTAGTNGAKDVFNTMSAIYRNNRNVSDWSGLRCYERPGYIRLGTATNGGWIMTPPLSGLSSTPQTVVLSLDMSRADNEKGGFIVSAEGAGVVMNGIINESVLPAPTAAAERKWTTLTFTVEGATNQTQIKISAEDLTVAGSRMNLDNIVVMGAAGPSVTEKLETPDTDKIVYTPGNTSIGFSWEPIKGATGYVVSIARQESPDFKNIVETATTDYEFTGLTPGFYIFTLKAVYTTNPEFNSDEVTIVSGTAGFVAEKLATPQNLSFTGASSSVTVNWDAVSGASEYKVVLKTADGLTVLQTGTASTNSHKFTGLTLLTNYVVTVQAVVPGDAQYNSDEATINVTTTDATQLRTPSITSVYETGYLHAIVEFDYEDWVVTAGNIPQFAFRVETADGTLVPAYTSIEQGLQQTADNKYSFNNNMGRVGSNLKYSNPRFYLGGLEPNTSYKAYVRVVAYKDEDLTSEWSPAVSFTTKAAPNTSGYLFYKDFDDFWWGSNHVTMACSPIPQTAVGSMTTIDFNQPYYATTNPVSTYGNLSSMTQAHASYGPLLRKFMPEWGDENGSSFASGTVNLVAGHLKFGTGSVTGSLTLPKLAALGATPTNIILEFDACPYYEPASTGAYFPTTNPAKPGAADDCYVWINEGDGVITNWNGTAQANVKEVQVVSKSQDEMNPAIKQYQYTRHTVKISGATEDTRITIKSTKTDGSGRLWLDNITVRKE